MPTPTDRPHLAEHQDRFLAELIEFLSIPSISARPEHDADTRRAADWLAGSLDKAGATRVEVFPTGGHPMVYAERMSDPALPTVLVYGHYDVQPPEPLELWTSGPFEPVIKNNRIYARGASDDKGQVYMHVKALELLAAVAGPGGALPVNLKFIFEGEEEVGSANLGAFLEANKERLAADVILISDTGMLSMQDPSICVGLRGLAYMMVKVIGPGRDLHSGMYGGAVANPINALCDMIARLHDADRRVTIPGFYDGVIELSAEDRAEMARAPFSESEFMADLNIEGVQGESGYTTLERRSIRPTLDVNGIWGGYTGEGAKTVIASEANAKISMRLVPGQDPERIAQLFSEHFPTLAPAGIRVEVESHHGGHPALTPTDSPAYEAAARAIERTFGKRPIPMREGGSIPIVALFERVLGLKSVMLGFGLDTDAIHSPNEHYGIDNFMMGIETLMAFHHEFGQLGRAEVSGRAAMAGASMNAAS